MAGEQVHRCASVRQGVTSSVQVLRCAGVLYLPLIYAPPARYLGT